MTLSLGFPVAGFPAASLFLQLVPLHTAAEGVISQRLLAHAAPLSYCGNPHAHVRLQHQYPSSCACYAGLC